MSISRASIRTSVWDIVYTHLQTGTYALTTNNIFSSWNSTLAQDKGYPLVIIKPPITSLVKLSANQQITASEVIVNIEVYHTSAENLKSVMDSISNSLYTGRKVFQANRLMNMEIGSENYDSWEEGQRKIHVGSMDVNWRYIES
jgi:6-phosphogluconate dehydrogenase